MNNNFSNISPRNGIHVILEAAKALSALGITPTPQDIRDILRLEAETSDYEPLLQCLERLQAASKGNRNSGTFNN